MKKFFALLMAAVMSLSLVACSNNTTDPTPNPDASNPGTEAEGMIALVTDVGTIDDESFNQACWEGVVSYAEANGIDYEYKQPAADSDDERLASIRQAVNDGATVIVLPGYLFGPAAYQAQDMYPDVKFIAIDVAFTDILAAAGVDTNAADFDPNSYNVSDYVKENLYCAVFGEEQCGYLAGYAAVMDGFTELGFLGGMSVPAVQRYGYGFVQGADAAAQETGANINIKYTYGGQFFGDANITAKMEGWYQNGTQVVFACGGGIYTSAVEAALNNHGYVIGVDVDQHYIGENENYDYNPFITSAMKGLQAATESALDLFFNDKWSEIGGHIDTLNLQAGDYVGIPTAESSWGFQIFTLEQYNTLLESIKNGTIVVSADTSAMPQVSANTTVTVVE